MGPLQEPGGNQAFELAPPDGSQRLGPGYATVLTRSDSDQVLECHFSSQHSRAGHTGACQTRVELPSWAEGG